MFLVSPRPLLTLLILHLLILATTAKDVLKISSFSECLDDADIFINNADIEYSASERVIKFDVSGTSKKSQNVKVVMKVEAYGKDVYTKEFNPCDEETLVKNLCPVPEGTFSAASTQTIPPEFASQIPDIAFSIPDIALQATITLQKIEDGSNVGCVVADLANGKSLDSSAITYGAAAVAAAALLISLATSLLSGSSSSSPGESISSTPSFSDTISWFQVVASSGMFSVSYAPLYRSFTTRFAFSTGLISFPGLQKAIDEFRSRTGGNLTTSSLSALKNSTSTLSRRQIDFSAAGNTTTDGSIHNNIVRSLGIDAYIASIPIPVSNAFMTVFLIALIVLLAITLAILLFKTILEAWALCGSFPKSLTGFRKHYWGTISRTIVLLINTFFGIWVLYSIHQFKSGDSWAATLIAAVTLFLFASILAFFAWKIFAAARRHVKLEGSVARLFEDKEIWIKYSLFYNTYHQKTWWFFAPSIFYNLIRYTLIAALDGRGLAQTVSVLVVEISMLGLLIWLRPFERKRENFVHILIHVVRVMLSAAILVFVDELKVERSTQTIMGFVLVIITSVLTVLLVGLLLFNAIYVCCKDNPHRKRRKEAEKQRRESEFFLQPGDRNAHTSYHSSGNMEYIGAAGEQQQRWSDPSKVPLNSSRMV